MVLISNLLLHRKSDKPFSLFDDEDPYRVKIKKDDHYVEYDEWIPIKGVPGRQSFKLFPEKKKMFWRPEALDLRCWFALMAPFHAFFLVYNDIYMYRFEISAMLVDALCIWFDYFNYMTLNKLFMVLQVSLMGIASLIAFITQFQSVFFRNPQFDVIICFVTQYMLLTPLFVYNIGFKLYNYAMLQNKEHERILSKTVKGKLKVKIRQEILLSSIPVTIDRLNLFQNDPEGFEQKDEENWMPVIKKEKEKKAKKPKK